MKKHETKPETRYYYKAKNGNGLMNLRSPLSEAELENYEAITEEQWLALQPQHHEPSEAEIALREKRREISHLKAELAKTDYQAIKHSEGWITEEEYAPIKASRQALRDRINELEGELE